MGLTPPGILFDAIWFTWPPKGTLVYFERFGYERLLLPSHYYNVSDDTGIATFSQVWWLGHLRGDGFAALPFRGCWVSTDCYPVSKIGCEATDPRLELLLSLSLSWKWAVKHFPLARTIKRRFLADGIITDTLYRINIHSDHEHQQFPAAVGTDSTFT